jgi:hypothetical protein
MTDDDKKLLTKFLGECWHEKSGISYFCPVLPGFPTRPDSFLCSKCGAKFTEDQIRTFTTWQDLGDLLNKLSEKWDRWDRFSLYAWHRWWNEGDEDEHPTPSIKDMRRDFSLWLLNPAVFIPLCVEFLRREAQHGSE